MANLNKVFLIGNLTRDPELKYTPSGVAVANFTLAINRKYKSGDEVKEEATFLPCVAWQKTAEVLNRYVYKGDPLFVEGRLQVRTWEDKKGDKRYTTEIVVEKIQFLGGKREDASDPNLPTNDPIKPTLPTKEKQDDLPF